MPSTTKPMPGHFPASRTTSSASEASSLNSANNESATAAKTRPIVKNKAAGPSQRKDSQHQNEPRSRSKTPSQIGSPHLVDSPSNIESPRKVESPSLPGSKSTSQYKVPRQNKSVFENEASCQDSFTSDLSEWHDEQKALNVPAPAGEPEVDGVAVSLMELSELFDIAQAKTESFMALARAASRSIRGDYGKAMREQYKAYVESDMHALEFIAARIEEKRKVVKTSAVSKSFIILPSYKPLMALTNNSNVPTGLRSARDIFEKVFPTPDNNRIASIIVHGESVPPSWEHLEKARKKMNEAFVWRTCVEEVRTLLEEQRKSNRR